MIKSTKAFTLVELSIVLVIIGLIVFAITSGADMIKAAEIRSQIAQIREVQTAFSTFKTKYDALPGDIHREVAPRFGLTRSNGGGDGGYPYGYGDENGWITSRKAPSDSNSGYPLRPVGETIGVWVHLYESGLFTNAPYYTGEWNSGSLINNRFVDLLPTATLGDDNLLVIAARYDCPELRDGTYDATTCRNNGGAFIYNELHILRNTNNGIFDSGGINAATLFREGPTPYEAYSIDAKLDDGLPITGIVQGYAAFQNNPYHYYRTRDSDNCFFNDSGTIKYDLSRADDKNLCRIGIRLD